MATRKFSKGFGGGMDMNAMMKQAQKLQEQMLKAQDELKSCEYIGTSGEGAVSATVTGANELIDLKIDSKLINPDDVDMLQDLVVVAINRALKLADEQSNEQMKKFTGGNNTPF